MGFTQNDEKHFEVGVSWGTEPVPAIHNKGAAAMAVSRREEQPSPQQFLLPTAVVTRDISKQFGTNIPLPLFNSSCCQTEDFQLHGGF